MDKSKVKEILIRARSQEEKEIIKKGRSYKKAYFRLKRRVMREREGALFDNFYLIEEAYSSVKGVRISPKLRYYASILLSVMTSESISDDLSAFFDVVSDTLESDQCERVREALFGECIIALADKSLESPELIRGLQAFDFAPFMMGYVRYEQLLRRDSVYAHLDRESRALYKEKIKIYSKKRGLTFTEGCQRLTDEASEKKCHIGELLPFQNGESLWLTVPLAFFVVLSYVMIRALRTALSPTLTATVFLLSLLPLWQTAFDLFVPVVARFRKSDILPRIDLPKITEDCATLTAVATLGTSVEEVKRIFSNLELISLKTRSRGKDEFAFWGVLLDLPESKSPKGAEDEKIIKEAKKEVDRLNRLYNNRFLLFTRERVFNERDGIYTSHERKRGAIVELVKLLDGKESRLETYGVALPKIKYVLTLDSDTDMELGALNRMVGTMLHPMNTPVIEERGGVRVVTKGFGILQPALVNTIESAYKTRFSALMSGAGGVDAYHSSIFNLNSVLFGRGLFCGKGLFDVSAFAQTLIDAFPDGIVLSHDILEGTRLRAGYLSDICFFDSVPSNAISFYNRAHRWARGDIQSLVFTGRYVNAPKGKIKNPMLSSERFVFFMNTASLTVPIFQVLGLFALMWYGIEELTLVSFFFLLPSFTPLLNEVLRSSFHGSLTNILRRFFGDTVTALYRESIMLGYRLSALAFQAYKNTDAIVRSIWRMRVSGKKLLEWTTASQGEKKKNSLSSSFLYTLPSFLAGVFMLSFSKLSLCKLIGILWCIFFIVAYYLGKSAPQKELSPQRKKTLTRYARDIWCYFEKYVDETNNHLPPDNVSVFPSSDIAYRTSPTNIGLYLLAVQSALDFSFITPDEALDRIEKTVTTIEKMPKYRGQLYNWYSTVSLEVIGQEYISTVDSGNFIACLVALYEGLAPLEKGNKRVRELRTRIKQIENETDFRFLFNPSRNLFSLGFFTDGEKQDTIVYDMYMSEARTTDYYAVARGIVRDSHWWSLSRPLITTLGGIGALSWSGTAFEYFMPHLLLPLYKNSFAQEALSYAFSEQIKASASLGRERVFGISESGYFAFDESLGYQYRAFGVSSLSRRVEGESQMVISPYSSFLMLRAGTGIAMKNLEALERWGMYGEFGFYEAVDLCPSRVGDRASVVKSFMSHHMGMSLVACANAVFDDVFVKRFMSDKEMKAVSELLKEAVPADANGVKKEKLQKPVEPRKRISATARDSGLRTEASTWALTGKEASAVFFERGVISVDLSCGKGKFISAIQPVDQTRNFSLFVFSRVGDRVSSPSVSPDVSYSFDSGFVEYRQGELTATFSLSSRTTAMRIRLEAEGEKGCVGLYLEPLFTTLDGFLSHPAFHNLFFKAEYSDSTLVLTRQGEKPYSFALVASTPFTFETSRERLFDKTEFCLEALVNATARSLSRETECLPISPCVFVKSDFTARTETTFVLGWGRTKSEAITNAREELEIPFSRSVKHSRELFYSALTAAGGDFDRSIYEALLTALRPQASPAFKSSLPEAFGKGAVYSMGLSGDLPVFLVKKDRPREELEKLLQCHKLHYIMGVRYELLLEISGDGYYAGGKGELEALIDRLQCTFLVGRRGGIHFADLTTISQTALHSLASCTYPSQRRITKFPYNQTVTEVHQCEAEEGDILIKEKPSVLWSHVIASATFGTMLSHRSLGNTWVYNSRLSRITYWENDSVGGYFSEKLLMEKDGVYKDLCASAFATRFSCGRAEYIGRHFNIKVAIHPTLMFKAVSVTVENDDFSLLYRFLPVLDDFPRPSGRIEYFSDSKSSVIFKNVFSDSLTDGFGYLLLPFEKEIELSDGFGVRCARGGEVVFVLGYAKGQRHYDAVREYFTTHRFSDVWLLSHSFLYNPLKNEKDFWISYQTLVSRFFARSGPYQSGGAWGFRDQAQDCLSLLDVSPKTVYAHIMRMASHQYKEGDVQHWWHSRRGVRTHCSDDYLWLVWLTCIYVLRTKDKSILGCETHYLNSAPLTRFEKDRYEIPEKTPERYPLSHHLKSALDLLVSRGLGEHSLPFILGGDWNDGMNMLPDGSESVWLAFFARLVIHLYTEVTGDKSYCELSERLKNGIESYAFFSDRYARAFLPDGEVLGVEGSDYFCIDALPQAFASLCHAVIGDGNPSRITLALDSAWKSLYDPKKRIFKLFTPPIDTFDKKIGYLSAYPEGMRENGGQYTHASVWSAMAFLYAPEKREENLKRAKTLAEALNPATHDGEVYKTEPYVLCGDVYSNGRGGWSWYTGSASWYRDLILRLSDEKRNKRTPLT
ncbi:MAG: DUF3131 domain-containing protein [Clostridia bacterium]|nr:DUF3131 domain-containing protein [Clostridia bacterium]